MQKVVKSKKSWNYLSALLELGREGESTVLQPPSDSNVSSARLALAAGCRQGTATKCFITVQLESNTFGLCPSRKEQSSAVTDFLTPSPGLCLSPQIETVEETRRPSQRLMLLGPFPISEFSQDFGYILPCPVLQSCTAGRTPCPGRSRLALVPRPPSPGHQQ